MYGKIKVYKGGKLHCTKYTELNSSMNIKYYESSSGCALVLAKAGFVSRSSLCF